MEMTREQAIEKVNKELARYKVYFPYRIAWGAINPETNAVECGCSKTRRTVNDYIRKGWECYVL